MPIERGYQYVDGERKGFFRWSGGGEKYFYTPGHKPSRERAKNKAKEQQQAAYASGYDG